jgi:acyl-CoA reductase-like NAD-dependent aldehyde dehydrogenase
MPELWHPVLAAGCTVVLKPAPDTPWTAALLGQLVADETDIPPGVFNVVTSSGHEVGQQLCGREMGQAGLDEYLEIKTVAVGA